MCVPAFWRWHRFSNDPITVIVSSPGGHVESGDMIHDTIKFISPEVRILGMGWVASAGALIYVSVPKELRFCTPNTRFLLHPTVRWRRRHGNGH